MRRVKTVAMMRGSAFLGGVDRAITSASFFADENSVCMPFAVLMRVYVGDESVSLEIIETEEDYSVQTSELACRIEAAAAGKRALIGQMMRQRGVNFREDCGVAVKLTTKKNLASAIRCVAEAALAASRELRAEEPGSDQAAGDDA